MTLDAASIAAEVDAALTEIVGAANNGFIVKARTKNNATGTEAFYPTKEESSQHTYHDCKVMVSRWAARDVDGELIRMTDTRLLFSPLSCEVIPEVGDYFWDGVSVVDGKHMLGRIVEPLSRTRPTNVDIMLALNVRY